MRELETAEFERRLQALSDELKRGFAALNKMDKNTSCGLKSWSRILLFRALMSVESIEILSSPLPFRRLERHFDHFSIMALARNIVDASIMLNYLLEANVPSDEGVLRIWVFLLHDNDSAHRVRKRLLKQGGTPLSIEMIETIGKAEEIYAPERKKLKNYIARNGAFKRLSKERQERLLGGNEVFVHGLRAAVRASGFNCEGYDATNAFLSGHVHSHPTLFIRGLVNCIDLWAVSQAQIDLSAMSFDIATGWLQAATDRVQEYFDLGERKA